ncbi:methyl-accepting chemotaxis protein [Exilibacterium tricleocarpae]|uniref:Methyl-accepting chemotaxis protein n=1 Tax=Exilibacterium tricleocarpae TaxID=2591008 RepID=A0A545U3S7_9GAMM|nr:methyl-accepting chemotaxis protein [Exilibacterium tricleocarpae]TQV84120.1 methyl-accepting chemotaxis protein [Exilibacterium tricleocarpae]
MINLLTNLPLAAKVWLAPALLMLLLLFFGGFTMFNNLSLEKEIRVFAEDLTADTNLASQTVADILRQRLTLKSYLKSSDPRAVAVFRQQATSARTRLSQAKEAITHPQRVKLVQTISTLHEEYSRLFEEKVVSNMNRRHELVEGKLDANGKPMERALSEIMETAHKGGDIETAFEAGVAQRHLLLARLYAYKFLMNNDVESRERATQELRELTTDLSVLQSNSLSPEMRSLTDQVAARLAVYQEGFAGVVTAIETRNAAVARMDAIGPEVAAESEKLHASVAESLDEQGRFIEGLMEDAGKASVTLTLVALLLGCGITWFIVQAILLALRRTNEMLAEIADGDGDLTARLDVKGNDELGELASNFNRFVAKLHDIISAVQTSTGQLVAASEGLNQVSAESRTTVDKQVAETDLVATAVEQMSATLNQVASNVQETAQSADQARAEAEQGRDIESQALAAIATLGEQIRESAAVIDTVGNASETVDTVVEVINSIAEQTNLLALNAAIEAARAGEQGRGFAVVADEVRTLASRTRESTEEIRKTVEQLRSSAQQAVGRMNASRDQAEAVVEQAQQVDQALEGIVTRVQQMDSMIRQIATATEEQTAVTGEINKNLVNVKDQAGDSARASEQLNDSAAQFARLAAELQSQVGRFRVSG